MRTRTFSDLGLLAVSILMFGVGIPELVTRVETGFLSLLHALRWTEHATTLAWSDLISRYLYLILYAFVPLAFIYIAALCVVVGINFRQFSRQRKKETKFDQKSPWLAKVAIDVVVCTLVIAVCGWVTVEAVNIPPLPLTALGVAKGVGLLLFLRFIVMLSIVVGVSAAGEILIMHFWRRKKSQTYEQLELQRERFKQSARKRLRRRD